MTTDKITLLPCPFCGGEAEILETPRYERGPYLLNHDNCFIDVAVFFKTKDDAITKWNTRAPMKGTDNG